jgi:hypothetical protein
MINFHTADLFTFSDALSIPAFIAASILISTLAGSFTVASEEFSIRRPAADSPIATDAAYSGLKN